MVWLNSVTWTGELYVAPRCRNTASSGLERGARAGSCLAHAPRLLEGCVFCLEKNHGFFTHCLPAGLVLQSELFNHECKGTKKKKQKRSLSRLSHLKWVTTWRTWMIFHGKTHGDCQINTIPHPKENFRNLLKRSDLEGGLSNHVQPNTHDPKTSKNPKVYSAVHDTSIVHGWWLFMMVDGCSWWLMTISWWWLMVDAWWPKDEKNDYRTDLSFCCSVQNRLASLRTTGWLKHLRMGFPVHGLEQSPMYWVV